MIDLEHTFVRPTLYWDHSNDTVSRKRGEDAPPAGVEGATETERDTFNLINASALAFVPIRDNLTIGGTLGSARYRAKNVVDRAENYDATGNTAREEEDSSGFWLASGGAYAAFGGQDASFGFAADAQLLRRPATHEQRMGDRRYTRFPKF